MVGAVTAIVQVIDAGVGGVAILVGHRQRDGGTALRQRRLDGVREIIAALYWCQGKPRRTLCDLAAAVDAQVKSGGVNAAIVVSQLGGDGWGAGIDPAVR